MASIRAAAALSPAASDTASSKTDVLGQIDVSIAAGNVNAAGRVTNRESPGPRAVLSMAAAGHQFQASIGGEPARKDFIPPGREVDINGQTFTGPMYACYDTTFGEISVVSLGADTTTSTTIAAQRSQIMAEEKKPDFSEFCKAAGFDPGTLNDKQKASMANMHAKMLPPATSRPRRQERRREEGGREEGRGSRLPPPSRPRTAHPMHRQHHRPSAPKLTTASPRSKRPAKSTPTSAPRPWRATGTTRGSRTRSN